MGQKVNPIALRLQKTNLHFDSYWCSDYYYPTLISKDLMIRDYLNNIFKQFNYSEGRFLIQHLPKKLVIFQFLCSINTLIDIETLKKKKRKVRRKNFKRKVKRKNLKIFNSVVVKKEKKSLLVNSNSQYFNNLNYNAKIAPFFFNINNLNYNVKVAQFLFNLTIAAQQILPATKNTFLKKKKGISVLKKKTETIFKSTVLFSQKKKQKNIKKKGQNIQHINKKQLFVNKPSFDFLYRKAENLYFFRYFLLILCFSQQHFKQKQYLLNNSAMDLNYMKGMLQKSFLFFKNKIENQKNFSEKYYALVPLFALEKKNNQKKKNSFSTYPGSVFTYKEAAYKKADKAASEVVKKSASEVVKKSASEVVKKSVSLKSAKVRALTLADFTAMKKKQLLKSIFFDVIKNKNNKQPEKNKKLKAFFPLALQKTFKSFLPKHSTYSNQVLKLVKLFFSKNNNSYREHLETVLYNQLLTNVFLFTFKASTPFQSALFLAQEIVYWLERKVTFREIKNKLARSKYIKEDIRELKGIRISCSGRLGGRSKKAQRAKTQSFKMGQTSLHVFSNKIDFKSTYALTRYGIVGVKVWICYY